MSDYLEMRTIQKTVMAMLTCVVAFGAAAGVARADENVSLDKIIAKHREAIFAEVGDYVKAHPDAKDIDDAYLHLFRDGLMHDMEVPALPYAELYLRRERQNPALANLAQRIRCMAMAEEGYFEEAFVVFESLLATSGPQSGEAMASVAMSLAGKARTAEEPGISRDIFELLAARYPDDRKVNMIAQTSLMKQDLVGKPAPALGVPDVKGDTIEWDQYKGKVVLVDFWATWCGPCLAELPNLKKVYDEFHKDGFEVIGISRDYDEETVKAFVAAEDIPWRNAMDETGEVKLRERFNVELIPSTFLVDRDGTIVQFDMRGEDVREQVARLIKQK